MGCYLSSSVFQLMVLIHVIVLNIKIVKLVKFHVTSSGDKNAPYKKVFIPLNILIVYI
jgi:hypothetical protein